MANYTISTYTASLIGGAAVADTAVLTVTPNAGYVVSANDFSIGTVTTTPINTSGSVFSDTATAGALGNTVECAVDIVDNYTMPTSNTTLDIKIDGEAVLWVVEDGGGSNEVGTFVNVINCGGNGTVSVSSAIGTAAGLGGTHHGKSGDSVTVLANQPASTGIKTNTTTEIAEITVAASNLYEFNNAPTLQHGYTSRSVAYTEDILSMDLKSVTESGGSTTVYVYGLKYNAGSSYTAVDDLTVCVDYDATLIESMADEITKVDFGSSTVNSLGETRKISIHGRQGATFTYQLSDGSGDVVPITSGEIPYAGDFNTGQGVFTFDADIPANASRTLTLEVLATNATALATDLVNAPDLSQKDNPVLSFNIENDGGPAWVLPTLPSDTQTVHTGEPNVLVEDIVYKNSVVSSFTLKYTPVVALSGTTLVVIGSKDTLVVGDWAKSPNTDLGNVWSVKNGTVTTTAGSDNTASITATIMLERFGTDDQTFTLDLNQLLQEF